MGPRRGGGGEQIQGLEPPTGGIGMEAMAGVLFLEIPFITSPVWM